MFLLDSGVGVKAASRMPQRSLGLRLEVAGYGLRGAGPSSLAFRI